MWRVKMKKWCFNSFLFHSSYLPNCYSNFSQMKSYCSSSLNKKILTDPIFKLFFFSFSCFHDQLSPSLLFSFSFLPFSPALSPLSSVEVVERWSWPFQNPTGTYFKYRSSHRMVEPWSAGLSPWWSGTDLGSWWSGADLGLWWSTDLTSQEQRDEERDGDGLVKMGLLSCWIFWSCWLDLHRRIEDDFGWFRSELLGFGCTVCNFVFDFGMVLVVGF